MSEFENEPIPGLPEHLPAGERILVQCAPHWKTLARVAFHTHKVAIYFALLIGWGVVSELADGQSAMTAAAAALWLSAVALCALGVLSLLAWLTSRTTIYTITNRRLVIRLGIALPMTVNIPFRIVESAGLKTYADGSGDITLALGGSDRVAYLVLWPHARPWRFARPQPMLRGIPDANRVAAVLSRALDIAAGNTVRPDVAATADSIGQPARPLATAS